MTRPLTDVVECANWNERKCFSGNMLHRCSNHQRPQFDAGIPPIGAVMKIVSYIRVSTKAQGNSGLGLEAQRAAVASFAKARGAESSGRVPGGRNRQAERPSRTGQGPGPLPPVEGDVGGGQAGPAGPERGVHVGAHGQRRGFRLLRQPARQPPDHPHLGRGGGSRGRGDLRADEGGVGRGQGPWGEAGVQPGLGTGKAGRSEGWRERSLPPRPLLRPTNGRPRKPMPTCCPSP